MSGRIAGTPLPVYLVLPFPAGVAVSLARCRLSTFVRLCLASPPPRQSARRSEVPCETTRPKSF